VGDTITNFNNPSPNSLPGYKTLKSVVFCGLFPLDPADYNNLRDALEKLKLNDASFMFEAETSQALGFGFRSGFLGLLHMEIIVERIQREFNIGILATSPSVVYEVVMNDGKKIMIDNPTKLPNRNDIDEIREPIILATIMSPKEYVGTIMELCQKKRGTFKNINYMDSNRVTVEYILPLSEIVYDFFDKLKSYTKGYATFDYDIKGYQKADLLKMDILLNGEVVDALSLIVHKDFAYGRGKGICEKMVDLVPRQMFEIPVQAALGSKIIARTTIKALRKDVLSKCYGGDISRKKKLLQKQKEGKKRMKMVGKVEVPQEAFLAILSSNKEK
jgi:GTP-binding protein LepA